MCHLERLGRGYLCRTLAHVLPTEARDRVGNGSSGDYSNDGSSNRRGEHHPPEEIDIPHPQAAELAAALASTRI